MKYLVDTDVVIDYLVGAEPSPQAMAKFWRDGLAISIITYIEISEGIRGSRNPRDHALVFRRFLNGSRFSASAGRSLTESLTSASTSGRNIDRPTIAH